MLLSPEKLTNTAFFRLVAHALSALGLPSGSSIAIDMPMNVDAVVIYLAIVLTGNIVVSIADSFAPTEIATRLRIAKAKAIFTQVTLHFRELTTVELSLLNNKYKLPRTSRPGMGRLENNAISIGVKS